MNWTNVIVLAIVVLLLFLVIFFRYLKPRLQGKKTGGCSSCPMAYDTKAKRMVKDYHKANKKAS